MRVAISLSPDKFNELFNCTFSWRFGIEKSCNAAFEIWPGPDGDTGFRKAPIYEPVQTLCDEAQWLW